MNPKDRRLLWVAQGFGSGRMRPAPGTWGSGVGLAWAALLLLFCPRWLFWILSIAGVPIAIWICGRAEHILGETDPSSVVLDEIVAMPLCFVPFLLKAELFLVGVAHPETAHPWMILLAVGFVLFRFFDILKPPPIRQLQRLPGGWGIVVDDVAAAGVAGVILAFLPLS